MKVSAKDNGDRKKRMMSIELKQEIIEKHERGVRVIELAKIYDRSTSTICTILKQKDAIKSATPAKGTTILSQLRTNIHEEMEKLLLVWVKEKELAGDTVTETVICEKARSIYADLVKKEASTSKEASEEAFKASHGWFDNFKKRTGINSVVRHGEAASADVKAADTYIPSPLPPPRRSPSSAALVCLQRSHQSGIQWAREAILLLIDTYRRHRGDFESPLVKKVDVWRRISSVMAASGYTYNPDQCDKKMRALKFRYKTIRDNVGKATARGRSSWEFFDLVRDLVGSAPHRGGGAAAVAAAVTSAPPPKARKVRSDDDDAAVPPGNSAPNVAGTLPLPPPPPPPHSPPLPPRPGNNVAAASPSSFDRRRKRKRGGGGAGEPVDDGPPPRWFREFARSQDEAMRELMSIQREALRVARDRNDLLRSFTDLLKESLKK